MSFKVSLLEAELELYENKIQNLINRLQRQKQECEFSAKILNPYSKNDLCNHVLVGKTGPENNTLVQ